MFNAGIISIKKPDNVAKLARYKFEKSIADVLHGER